MAEAGRKILDLGRSAVCAIGQPSVMLAVAFFLVVIGLLGLAEAGAESPRCGLDNIACLFASHETLAAGLIGAAGTVFAGWLAYSAAQESAARAMAEAREAKRAALTEQVATCSADIDRLKVARGYLETYAANFPPTDFNASRRGFVTTFRECHARALDFLSSNAVRAPFGYGSQISTVMTRIEKLGERIEDLVRNSPTINPDVEWEDVVFDAVAGIRSLAEQIAGDIPMHEKYLLRLADERDKLAEESNRKVL
jgi:hypothetical protein